MKYVRCDFCKRNITAFPAPLQRSLTAASKDIGMSAGFVGEVWLMSEQGY